MSQGFVEFRNSIEKVITIGIGLRDPLGLPIICGIHFPTVAALKRSHPSVQGLTPKPVPHWWFEAHDQTSYVRYKYFLKSVSIKNNWNEEGTLSPTHLFSRENSHLRPCCIVPYKYSGTPPGLASPVW